MTRSRDRVHGDASNGRAVDGKKAGPGEGKPGGVPVVLVSGARSGVGKTLWVEALTRELSRRGLRVGVIKHHGHGTCSGKSGPKDPSRRKEAMKDTDRAREAGATDRVLVSENVLLWEGPRRGGSAVSLSMALSLLTALGRPLDVVLGEGFRDAQGYPRLWVGAPGGGDTAQEEGAWVNDAYRVTGDEAGHPEAVRRALEWLGLGAAGHGDTTGKDPTTV